MGKRFPPTKPWEWTVCAGLVAFFGAALWSPFAYSGPGPLAHLRVAYCAQKSHAFGEGWPRARAELKVWNDREPLDLRWKRTLARGAIYRIVVGDCDETWR